MTPESLPNGSPRRRWLSFVWLLGVASLAVSLGGAGWMMRGNASPAAAPAANGALTYHCIGYGDVPDGVSFPYPAMPGRVAEVKAREGQAFKAGDVLFRVDDRAPREDVARAENAIKAAELAVTKAANDRAELAKAVLAQKAAIDVAQQDVEQAQIKARRAHELVEKKALVKEDAEAADALVKKAEAATTAEQRKLDAMEAKGANIDLAERLARADLADKKLLLNKAKLAVDECAVTAPADGTVLRLDVRQGDLLGAQPKSPPLIFCPAGPRIVRAEVEQEWASRVQEGQLASIEDDTGSAEGSKWKGKVVRVGDWMAHRRSILPDPSQFHDIRTLECVIALDPNQAPLRIGQRVRVALSNP